MGSYFWRLSPCSGGWRWGGGGLFRGKDLLSRRSQDVVPGERTYHLRAPHKTTLLQILPGLLSSFSSNPGNTAPAVPILSPPPSTCATSSSSWATNLSKPPRLQPPPAPPPPLLASSLQRKKNGVKGESIGHGATGHPCACKVAAIQRREAHI